MRGIEARRQQALHIIRQRAVEHAGALDRRRAAHRRDVRARAVPQEQRDEGQVTRDARHVQRRHGARPVVVEAEPRELRLQQPRQHAPRPRVPRAHEIRIRKRACGDRPP